MNVYLPEPVAGLEGPWLTEFQRDAARFIKAAFPDAQVKLREDLVSNPLQVTWRGWSDIVDEGNWKAVAFHLMDMTRRAR